MMAHGSHDILEKSRVYDSFEDAITDLDFIVSTTAKEKSGKVDYLEAAGLSAFLSAKQEVVKHVGLVFGSEESGLPNDILLKSNIGVTIPMATVHPSLSLAQAVMVLAYELAGMAPEVSKTPKSSKAQKGSNAPNSSNAHADHLAQTVQQNASWKELQERTEWLLKQSGIKPGTPLFHRIIERMSFMNASDARLAHSITSKLADLLKK
jgi:TrmH family RNA methyltransferase